MARRRAGRRRGGRLAPAEHRRLRRRPGQDRRRGQLGGRGARRLVCRRPGRGRPRENRRRGAALRHLPDTRPGPRRARARLLRRGPRPGSILAAGAARHDGPAAVQRRGARPGPLPAGSRRRGQRLARTARHRAGPGLGSRATTTCRPSPASPSTSPRSAPRSRDSSNGTPAQRTGRPPSDRAAAHLPADRYPRPENRRSTGLSEDRHRRGVRHPGDHQGVARPARRPVLRRPRVPQPLVVLRHGDRRTPALHPGAPAGPRRQAPQGHGRRRHRPGDPVADLARSPAPAKKMSPGNRRRWRTTASPRRSRSTPAGSPASPRSLRRTPSTQRKRSSAARASASTA